MIDWDRLPPAYQKDYEVMKLERMDDLDSLKIMRQMRKSVELDAKLNDREPQGLEEIDNTIRKLMGRLTNGKVGQT